MRFCDNENSLSFPTEIDDLLQSMGVYQELCTCSECTNSAWDGYVQFQGIEDEVAKSHPNPIVSEEIATLTTKSFDLFPKIVEWLSEILNLRDPRSLTVDSEITAQLRTRFSEHIQKVTGTLDINLQQVSIAAAANELRGFGLDASWVEPRAAQQVVNEAYPRISQLLSQRIDQAQATLRSILEAYVGRPVEEVIPALEKYLESVWSNLNRIAATELSRIYARGSLSQMEKCGVRLVHFRSRGVACPICSSLSRSGPWKIKHVPLPVDSTHPYCYCFLEPAGMSQSCYQEVSPSPPSSRIKFRPRQFRNNFRTILEHLYSKMGNSDPSALAKGGIPPNLFVGNSEILSRISRRGLSPPKTTPAVLYDPDINVLLLAEGVLRESCLNNRLPGVDSGVREWRDCFTSLKDLVHLSLLPYDWKVETDRDAPVYFSAGLKEAAAILFTKESFDWTSEAGEWFQENAHSTSQFLNALEIVTNLAYLLGDTYSERIQWLVDLRKGWSEWHQAFRDLGFRDSEIELLGDNTANPPYIEIDRAIERVTQERGVSIPRLWWLQ